MLSKKVIESIEGLKITLADGTKQREFSLKEIFDIDDSNLTKEFAGQSAMYAYFAAMQAKSDYGASQISFALEQEQAEADAAARMEMEKDGRKYTEAVIKGMISLDDECTKLNESLIGQKYETKLLKAICDALEMRANMLISMGSHIRHEMDQTGISIKERQFKDSLENVKKVTSKNR